MEPLRARASTASGFRIACVSWPWARMARASCRSSGSSLQTSSRNARRCSSGRSRALRSSSFRRANRSGSVAALLGETCPGLHTSPLRGFVSRWPEVVRARGPSAAEHSLNHRASRIGRESSLPQPGTAGAIRCDSPSGSPSPLFHNDCFWGTRGSRSQQDTSRGHLGLGLALREIFGARIKG